jgi:hypothetical protein
MTRSAIPALLLLAVLPCGGLAGGAAAAPEAGGLAIPGAYALPLYAAPALPPAPPLHLAARADTGSGSARRGAPPSGLPGATSARRGGSSRTALLAADRKRLSFLRGLAAARLGMPAWHSGTPPPAR